MPSTPPKPWCSRVLRVRSVALEPTVSRAAFTLIELMVVCLLIAILTAMIIPEMLGSYQDALLSGTSRKLLNVFDLAYSRAVSLQDANRVKLDPATGRYVVEQQVQRDGQEQFVAIRDVATGTGQLDPRISIRVQTPEPDQTDVSAGTSFAEQSSSITSDSSDDQITFYPDGTADNREVRLRDRDGYGLALRINPITARVKIITLNRHE